MTTPAPHPTGGTMSATETDHCHHDWMLRPESDTYECLICGEER